MWVLIDNYDSFTYILHQYLLQTGSDCTVYRNDEITLEELIELKPERLIISPGPETPLQSGICLSVIDHFHDKIPILGICLGHQAIGMYFGAELLHAPSPMHGKQSVITCSEHPVFHGLPPAISVMRYHSLALGDLQSTDLTTIATANDDGTIMALAHRRFPCIGIQFHPESIGTSYGLQILQNWAGMY